MLLLLAMLSGVGCTQRMDSRGVESSSLALRTPQATGAATSAEGTSNVAERAPVAAVRLGEAPAPQAHGSWPPFCLAPNYFLHGELTSSLHESERGVQIALQWSPDGSEVLFASGAQVYSVAADGSRLERLLDTSGLIYLGKSRYAPWALTSAVIAPDGERIAYAICRGYSPDWKNLADPDVARCHASLFSANRHFGGIVTEEDRGPCYMLPDMVRDYAAGPVRLTPGYSFEEILVWDRASQTTVRLAGGFAPAWSPDGTRLAFVSRYGHAYDPERPGGSGYRPRLLALYVVTADGRELQPLVRGDVARPPRWSPDGRLLAIVEDDGATVSLSVVSADGKGRQRLSETRSDPAWSPDGSRIAFVRGGSGSGGLYTIAPDGTDERRITTIEVFEDSRDWWDQSVAWSPDGSRLIYRCGGICVVTRDGLRVGSGTLASREGYSAAWSPDGTRIAVLSLGWDLGRSGPRVLVTTTPEGAEPQVLVIHDDEHGLLGVGVQGAIAPVDAAGCSAGTAVASAAANRGLVSDCDVLLRAQPVLAGSVPGALNWSPERPIAEWYGVVVGGTPPRVQGLSLDHPHTNGRVPPELVGLTELRELKLGGSLGGELPPALVELANLRVLHMLGSYIHGPIPTELGRLVQLEELTFLHTYLSGSIPPELAGLRRLRSLFFDSNRFLVGTIPPELGRLANLEGLGLSNNGLTGSIPAELGQLTNLRGLSLNGNQLTGPIPPELDALTKLEHLGLGGNQLTGCVPPGLRDRLGLADCR